MWLLLMSNGGENDRCSDVTLRVKCRGSLIIRLKAIKYKEDILSYLSSYIIFIFLAQYLVFLVEYRLVIDLWGRMSCSSNSDVPTISSSCWVIELSGDRVKGYCVEDQCKDLAYWRVLRLISLDAGYYHCGNYQSCLILSESRRVNHLTRLWKKTLFVGHLDNAFI